MSRIDEIKVQQKKLAMKLNSYSFV